MKWICYDCNWTGSYEELECDVNGYYCPICNGEVDLDDGERDPIDERNADYVRDGLQAVRGQM